MTEKKWYKNPWIILGIIVLTLALIYTGISLFFANRFFYNTKINNIDFSLKTEKQVNNYFSSHVVDYTLSILTLDNQTEIINGSDIEIKYVDKKGIKKLLKKQNNFLWPTFFFQPSFHDLPISVEFNEAILLEKFNQLACVTNLEQTDPMNASVKYMADSFQIEAETYGTKVNTEMMTQKIKDYISSFKPELNMTEEECYIKPAFTSESPELLTVKDSLNSYLNASITYNVAPAAEVVDRHVISGFITYDEAFNVSINEEAVKAYVAGLAEKYNTVGKTRTIITPAGKTAEVSGGYYGWQIDQIAETQALIANINAKETVTRDIIYKKTAASHSPQDWGTTYIDVDMGAQHMWFIQEGTVVFECDIVTGIPNRQRATPAGVFNITEKMRNKTLVGNIVPETGEPEYETPVRYWARVTNTGIGFHDADWQPAYGGEIYKTWRGSHGCINMPVSSAKAFYEMISVGIPVIIHY